MKNPKFIPYWKNLLNFFLDKKTDWKPKAGVAFAVLYLIWPIDMIPDIAPILGWLDDIGITTLATGYLAYAVNRYISNIEQRTTNNDTDISNNELRTTNNDTDISNNELRTTNNDYDRIENKSENTKL